MTPRRGSSRRRRAHARARRESPPAGGRPVASATPIVLTAIPSRRSRLSDGVLVEALVVGRVLGVKLLTLRASVVLAPAEVIAASSARRALGIRPDGPPSRAAPARRPAAPPVRRPAAGSGLAEAVRRIDEGAELLAEARRNGVRRQRARDV
jgi:hypothetical protein